MTRVYLPASPGRVRAWLAERRVPGGVEGRAVTEGVAAALADSDLEEQEYAAMMAAAEESVALLTDTDLPRRMVVVVEGDVETVDDDAGLVRLKRDAAWGRVASLHVDASSAADDVAAARRGMTEEIRSRLDEHELEWFAAQEVASVVGGDG